MAVEQDRLVTQGSLRTTCPTMTGSWGGCLWRSIPRRTG
jgi:hypothetical protein